MYLEHFGLREFPFNITPDTSYFFSSDGSQKALNTLLIAARSGEGFIKITGEVGSGKTLLCRKLMASLGPEFKVAYIPNPYLEPRALFKGLAAELGIEIGPDTNPDQYQLLDLLTKRLLELVGEGRRVLVCLDEVQAMPIETLEALRLLTNLETEKRKLLQVVIFGQPELEERLNHPSIRQLKQRIAFDYHLGPLTHDEMAYYIQHRLMVAGHQGGRLFTPLALWMLGRKTKRIPRLVNIVAHKALLSAFGNGKKVVGMRNVLVAADDTPFLRKPRWLRQVVEFMVSFFLGGCLAAIGWMILS